MKAKKQSGKKSKPMLKMTMAQHKMMMKEEKGEYSKKGKGKC